MSPAQVRAVGFGSAFAHEMGRGGGRDGARVAGAKKAQKNNRRVQFHIIQELKVTEQQQ